MLAGRTALATSPWRRAPLLLLLRSPGVFVSCLLAAAILSMAASSGVLFLASTGTAALHNEAGLECPESSQPGITNDLGPTQYASAEQSPAGLRRGDPAVRSAMTSSGLPDPYLVATSYVSVAGGPPAGALLFARPGALSHVQLVASAGGTGVWVPQSFAAAHATRPGSMLPLGTGHARVAGVYRDLAPSAFTPLFQLPRYWCTWSSQLVPTPFNQPAPMFLTDLPTFLATAQTVDATWYAPVPVSAQTVPQARAALAAGDQALAVLTVPHYRGTSDLPYLLAKADRVRTGLAGPVVPIDLAGTLVAALLVAAAGAFWGLRRRRELVLLSSRGVGRVALGVKAVLETGPALAVGTIGGWLLALVLVRALGPSPLLEPGAPWTALGLSALVGLAALLAVGLTGARTVPSDRVARAVRRTRWIRHIPWELALVAASVLVFRLVRDRGAVHIVKATVQVSPLVLAFPLLALTGAVLLLGRAGGLALSRSGPLARRLPSAGYLALRRLSGTPAVAIGVLIGVALPVGVLVYSSALSGSTSADVRAKYGTNVGADFAFGTLAAPGSTPDVDGNGTIVSMIQADPHIDGGTAVQVMAIDPATFSSFAFNGAQLRGLTDRLTADAGPVAALLVNAPAGTPVTHVQIRSVSVPLHIVGTRSSFPGLRNPFAPLLVVNRNALPPLAPMTDRTEELWTTTTTVSAALGALTHDGVESNYEITTKTFLDNTGLRPVTWIFGYLQALAYLTGLVAFAGLTFAFTAQTRRRALSYRLARRMGLSRAGHRRSIAIELATLLVVSWTLGAGLAMGAVALVYRLTDAYPRLPPAPDLPAPVVALAATGTALLGAAVLGTWALQRLLDRIGSADLLRA
ncbi:MAG: hypothetical protein ACRDWT_06195 [Jatrophihabitantaceae bacterium]